MTARPSIFAPDSAPILLPEPFIRWFAGHGWAPRPHQLELLAKAEAGASVLLIAPTGAGKTLAGFLPALVDLSRRRRRKPGERPRGVHTLYISPLKALATDIARNLERPVEEIGLAVTMETRTGDTSQVRRQRQKLKPPDILLTTPEQLALLIAGAIRTVGVLLITSLLVIPAASARRLTHTPAQMAAVASVLGTLSVLAGLAVSWFANTPVGPSIVVAASSVFVLTLLRKPA